MADVIIDDRLLDANCQEKIEENFNRVLDMIDSGGGSGGGAGVFWVNITSPVGGTTWTADKTVDEVLAAAESGQLVCALVDGEAYVPLASGYAEDGYKSLTFASVSPGDYDSGAKRLLINTTKIDYSAEGTVTNLAVETGAYSFSVSKIG